MEETWQEFPGNSLLRIPWRIRFGNKGWSPIINPAKNPWRLFGKKKNHRPLSGNPSRNFWRNFYKRIGSNAWRNPCEISWGISERISTFKTLGTLKNPHRCLWNNPWMIFLRNPTRKKTRTRFTIFEGVTVRFPSGITGGISLRSNANSRRNRRRNPLWKYQKESLEEPLENPRK